MEITDEGFETSTNEGQFIISIEEETDFSPNGGYNFLSHKASSSLAMEDAKKLLKELEEFISTGR